VRDARSKEGGTGRLVTEKASLRGCVVMSAEEPPADQPSASVPSKEVGWDHLHFVRVAPRNDPCDGAKLQSEEGHHQLTAHDV
jgi:hypothetical protein